MHHETKASRTRNNGDPIDYVPNAVRSGGFNQEGNCMSRNYRRAKSRTYGTAPELWGKVPTPSLAVTKPGHAREVIEHREFRTGQTRAKAKVVAPTFETDYERRGRLLGFNRELASE